MKHSLILALVILLSFGSAPAQRRESETRATRLVTSTRAQPPVRRIIERFVEATGGRAAMLRQTSRVVRATVEIQGRGIVGTLESYAKAPNKSLNRMTLSNIGTIIEAFDGRTAWQQNPVTGATRVEGARLAALRRDADFYKYINFTNFFARTRLLGTTRVNNRLAYIVEAIPTEEDVPERYYFDAESGLLLRMDITRNGITSEQTTATVYFEDYALIDGITMPFTIRQVFPGLTFVMRITEVSHNVVIHDALFTSPFSQSER